MKGLNTNWGSLGLKWANYEDILPQKRNLTTQVDQVHLLKDMLSIQYGLVHCEVMPIGFTS